MIWPVPLFTLTVNMTSQGLVRSTGAGARRSSSFQAGTLADAARRYGHAMDSARALSTDLWTIRADRDRFSGSTRGPSGTLNASSYLQEAGSHGRRHPAPAPRRLRHPVGPRRCLARQASALAHSPQVSTQSEVVRGMGTRIPRGPSAQTSRRSEVARRYGHMDSARALSTDLSAIRPGRNRYSGPTRCSCGPPGAS